MTDFNFVGLLHRYGGEGGQISHDNMSNNFMQLVAQYRSCSKEHLVRAISRKVVNTSIVRSAVSNITLIVTSKTA